MVEVMRCIGFLLLALLLATAAAADERILDYRADIEVQTDGTLLLTETIRVRAEGRQIQRGIYRDFPLHYRGGLFNLRRIDLEILGVERDGHAEPWHTEWGSDRVRIYAGRSNRRLEPGEYTYTFRYWVGRALGALDGRDELYWNVTGNDWAFPIERASARVALPSTVPLEAVQAEAYTGPYGARGQDYQVEIDREGVQPVARFVTTRPLRRGEGLTIVVSWPQGFVWRPSALQRLGWVLGDTTVMRVGLVGLALLLAYFGWVWWWAGRDPAPGVIHPAYAPPEGFSPASLRFIRRMGYDHKAFATALVNLAVKGFLEITQKPGVLGSSRWTLKKTGRRVEMAAGEQALSKALFGGQGRVELDSRSRARVQKAVRAHRKALRRDYEKRYFVTNRWYWLGGALASLGVLGAALRGLRGEQFSGAAFLTIWLSVWTLGVGLLLGWLVRSWKNARAGIGSWFAVVGAALFALPFVAGELMGVWFLLNLAGLGYLLVLLGVLGTDAWFYHLLKAPTRAGRRLLDQVEGFRRYLAVAEAEEAAGDRRWEDLGLFERYLPYAMALDVEQAWAERFAQAIERAQAGGYHPSWYRGGTILGQGGSQGPAALAGGLAAGLSAAVATASSSGSGGGGASGGGGGGGGGGGW